MQTVGAIGTGSMRRRAARHRACTIDRAQLEKANVSTLGEFLQTVPGFGRDPSSALDRWR